MKVSELEGRNLDSWVDEALGYSRVNVPPYSTDWAVGGPIIEKEGITIIKEHPEMFVPESPYRGRIHWDAYIGYNEIQNGEELEYDAYGSGSTPLIAAMRCLVARKFGEEVPDSLPDAG